MKSTVLYHYYGPERTNSCCRQFNIKHLALTSGIYTINISILVVLLYSWQISVNMKKFQTLGDVYYGIQISHLAIIGANFSLMILSIVLVVGINSENAGLVVPWIIGILTFMSLEAVAMMYGNVLRDHIFGHFDGLCKAEVSFFVARTIFNSLALWSVMKFYHMVRSGISWKTNETVIEL
ncbi:unnamed protein product [Diamesa hyperborea]